MLAGAVLPAALAQPGHDSDGETFNPAGLSLLDNATPQTFEPFIGDRFAVRSGGLHLGSLTLLSVTVGPPASSTTRPPMTKPLPGTSTQALAVFSLRFKGSAARLPQDTYTLEHAALGSFPLFIVPAGRGVDPATCTAIFSLLA
jgi:hypothetical protein